MRDLHLRTKEVAEYLVINNSTIRNTAKAFGLGKSTVHYDLTFRLPYIDAELYEKVRHILNINFQEKNIRGGLATKKLIQSKKLFHNQKNWLISQKIIKKWDLF